MSGFRGEAADNRVFMADLDFTHDTTHTQHINTPSLPAFRTKLSYYWTHYFFKQQRQLYTEKNVSVNFLCLCYEYFLCFKAYEDSKAS